MSVSPRAIAGIGRARDKHPIDSALVPISGTRHVDLRLVPTTQLHQVRVRHAYVAAEHDDAPSVPRSTSPVATDRRESFADAAEVEFAAGRAERWCRARDRDTRRRIPGGS